ncbi:MAG: hypothetical protein HC857_00585 [Synechococcales cyanobacterium RU_4_20]|nr:hypothetical protein [Synechococcales cyanobacterium RU_4_20]
MTLAGIMKHMLFDPQIGWTPKLETFKLESDLDSEDIQGYPACGTGIAQVVNTVQKSETFTLTLSNADFDFIDFERLTGQKITDSTNIVLPQFSCHIIPNAAPYEISIAGLTSDQSLQITTQGVDAQHLLQQPEATATIEPGKFEVSAGKITFNAAQAGKQIGVNRFTTVAAAKTIGITNSPIGAVSFRGSILAPNAQNGVNEIYIPRATRSSGVSFGLGEASETQYKLNLTGGYTLPFVLWES